MSIVEKEDFDALEDKIAERQEVLDSISKLRFTKEEINKIAEELEIVNLSEKIADTINDKKVILKDQLQQNAIKQNANFNYNKSFYNSYHAFNKKV